MEKKTRTVSQLAKTGTDVIEVPVEIYIYDAFKLIYLIIKYKYGDQYSVVIFFEVVKHKQLLGSITKLSRSKSSKNRVLR